MPVQKEEVAQIWADVIGIPEVDVEANFFELGGTSMLLMKLVSRLNGQLGIETDVVMLMEYPTVEMFTTHWNDTEALVEEIR